MADNVITTLINIPSSDVVTASGNNPMTGTNKFGSASNYVQITNEGDLSLVGTATMYDDLRVNLANIKAPASDPPTWTTYKGCELPAFGAGGTNALYFTAQLPHTYKEGSDIEFHMHTVHPDGTSGNSRWQFTYCWANINGSFGTVQTLSATFASPAAADTHKTHSFGSITGTSKTISSVLLCSLSRIGGDALDTYGSVIYAIQADIHFEIDSMGSRTTTGK